MSSEKEKQEAELIARAEKELEISDEKDAETAALFNPANFLGLTTEVLFVKDELLGRIKYKRLTTKDLLSLRDEQGKLGNEGMSQKLIWLMMSKADPGFTWDQFQKLPHDVATRLLLALTPKIAFLPQTPTMQTSASSSPGSGKAERHRR